MISSLVKKVDQFKFDKNLYQLFIEIDKLIVYD